MKDVQVSDLMREKAKRAFEEATKMLKVFETADIPEPKCNICGRVIYCGVDKLCDLNPCGLKNS